ncbi:hypothetical protein B0T20DRAFT_442704 [Sordaria brevicollis]|uniref:Uncharacterized protein n=1 Tax=Sordaria brevicollis TaxID=83679 RepID=A0AAE0PB92_SORBR|nr:hypothetical protein B0T20DRAFT_442704 [Sordaria brevicollis]
MTFTVGKTSLHRVILLGLSWSMMARSATGQTTFFPNYEGVYIPVTGPASTVYCGSPFIFTTSGKWAGCWYQDDPQYWFATKCNAGTVSGADGNTEACPSAAPNCYTMTIFDHYPSPSQSWIEVGCAGVWNAYTIYREVEASTTSTSSTSTTTSTSSTSTILSSTSTSGPTATSAVPTSTSSPPPPPPTATEDPKPSTSKAWIAGPVAGGVAALILLGALFFWWRGRKNRQNSAETPSMAQTDAPGGYQPEYVGGNPHANNDTPHLHDPSTSSPPPVSSATYYPPSGPPHYGTNSPGLQDASNASQYTYPISGTPNTMSWQGSPRPVSEQDPAGMQYKHTVVEAP